MKTKTKQGQVKVVNALATIHQILDEIAPNGKLNCKMNILQNESTFTFTTSGVCATFHIQEIGQKEGGKL